ncbi:S8 family peptidase [Clostridium aminobutyricum]|uniref:S8 family peptidase n=1 Tax=Clostridium aminobutyricum TaxID=33953 RepID=UPI0031454DF1
MVRKSVVNKVLSEDYLDLVIDNSGINFEKDRENITPINNMHSMVHVPIEGLDRCIYQYNIYQFLYSLQSRISLEESGVFRVRNTLEYGFQGQGILIAVIDTGIEYQHQAFINPDNTSRIVSIWDQTINEGGEIPVGFTYGTEYTQEMINEALSSDNPLAIVPSTDENGHGTMIAGIAAGNDNPFEEFSGVAPKAELIIVKLKQAKRVNKNVFLVPEDRICYQDTDIMLGIKYAETVAQNLRRPLAICIALGTNQTGHDGHGALAAYLRSITQQSRMCAVIAVGNEGRKRRHYFGSMEDTQASAEFEMVVSRNDRGFSMELWTSSPSQVSIDITSPTGEHMPDVFPGIAECIIHSFSNPDSVIYINNIISESESGDQLILIRFMNPAEGTWTFKVNKLEQIYAQFNVWLPDGDFISDETYFVNASRDVTLTSPGDAEEPITMTAYDPETGEIGDFVSFGYTRSNFVKPDLAAPGVNITCPTLNNSYGSASGTGAAAAHTAGIVALVLEWGVFQGNQSLIRGVDIKSLLIRSAERRMDISYPNNIWGYGKVDVYSLFQLLR